MRRHLTPVPDAGTLLEIGLRVAVCEFFAPKVVSGEVIFNFETGMFIAAEVATPEEIEEAVQALREHLFRRDIRKGIGEDETDAAIRYEINLNIADDIIHGRRIVWNVITDEFVKADADPAEVEKFRADAVEAMTSYLVGRGGAEDFPSLERVIRGEH